MLPHKFKYILRLQALSNDWRYEKRIREASAPKKEAVNIFLPFSIFRKRSKSCFTVIYLVGGRGRRPAHVGPRGPHNLPC